MDQQKEEFELDITSLDGVWCIVLRLRGVKLDFVVVNHVLKMIRS